MSIKYIEFQNLLIDISDSIENCQEFGHSMKVSPELDKSIEMLKDVLHCLDDLSDMIQEAYEI